MPSTPGAKATYFDSLLMIKNIFFRRPVVGVTEVLVGV